MAPQGHNALLLLTWSPFDASPLTKLFLILVSNVRARRPATIAWTTILYMYGKPKTLKPYNYGYS